MFHLKFLYIFYYFNRINVILLICNLIFSVWVIDNKQGSVVILIFFIDIAIKTEPTKHVYKLQDLGTVNKKTNEDIKNCKSE